VDKRSLSQPVFDGDDVPVIEVEGLVESSEGCLNLSGDSAISSTSVVSSASTFEHPADIVSLYSFALDQCLCIVITILVHHTVSAGLKVTELKR